MSDLRPRRDHEPLPAATPAHARRLLVVANQTASSAVLARELRDRADRGPVRIHLVVPALNSRLRHWLSDIDDAVSTAERVARQAVATLGSRGLAISAEVGDSVPLLAIEDALSGFAADEIVISTLGPDRSHWLEQDLVQRARDRFGVQVSHVVAEDRAAHPSLTVGRHRPRGSVLHGRVATRARARSLRG